MPRKPLIPTAHNLYRTETHYVRGTSNYRPRFPTCREVSRGGSTRFAARVGRPQARDELMHQSQSPDPGMGQRQPAGDLQGRPSYLGSGRPIWNNDGDTATLIDPHNIVVSRYRY